MIKNKKITKETVAIIQLCDAIYLFNSEKYISAISLAAAAEEIFGVLSKRKTGSNSLEIESALFRMALNEKSYPPKRNRIRNELKHFDEDHQLEYESFKKTALIHISGAITNYKLFKKKLPSQKIILAYCHQRGII